MRAPACALAALFAIALSAPAWAQPHGQSDDGYRSSPLPYFTGIGRPSIEDPERDDDRHRRPAADRICPGRRCSEAASRSGHRMSGSATRARVRPRSTSSDEPPPVRTYRHDELPPRPPVVRERVADRETDGPGARVMIEADTRLIFAILEYEDLGLAICNGCRTCIRRDERRGTTTKKPVGATSKLAVRLCQPAARADPEPRVSSSVKRQ